MNIYEFALGQEKHVVLTSVTDPSLEIKKIKKKKKKVGNAANFCQIGCFSLFLRNKVKNAPKYCTFGCFKKNWVKKEKYRPIDPNIQEFHLRATQKFSFLVLWRRIVVIFYDNLVVDPVPWWRGATYLTILTKYCLRAEEWVVCK